MQRSEISRHCFDTFGWVAGMASSQ